MGHRLRHRFIRNAEVDTESYSVCMRWDVTLFCRARCCGGSEGIKVTWCRSGVTEVEDMHDPGYVLLSIPLLRLS
jgi:hypothetical protein